MLSRLGGLLLAAGLVLAVTATPVAADGGVVCDELGNCQVVVEKPGGGGGNNGGGGGGGGNNGGGGNPTEGEERYPCYFEKVAPQPPQSDPIWGGKTPQDGAVFQQICIGGHDPDGPGFRFIPNAEQADLPPPPPNPAVLAQRAVEAMNLKAVPIGIAPKSEAGKVGLVGLPVWMWSTSSASNVAGPTTKSASAGGWTVTATARLQRTVWDMGDGDSVTCSGSAALGTPYKAAYGNKASPTCGHKYAEQGTYQVSATSFWLIDWQGIGQTGQLSVDLTNSVDITIGELQVLTD
jgi:hypothetical protein